ncbi:hypothetical protein TH61_07825 [Rufibacter sp. DG15C]|uniref:hypothetical protein n=1 Tax=Rufibacter sp. DG15C TaxID=1379909 RepID=UPI00078CC1AE|nr:hypothetical protein [Rufibacter sp. DG15C]AMM51108.1 hypothetical protein TH61_07825 [Rufibacter sp. DG15C]
MKDGRTSAEETVPRYETSLIKDRPPILGSFLENTPKTAGWPALKKGKEGKLQQGNFVKGEGFLKEEALPRIIHYFDHV